MTGAVVDPSPALSQTPRHALTSVDDHQVEPRRPNRLAARHFGPLCAQSFSAPDKAPSRPTKGRSLSKVTVACSTGWMPVSAAAKIARVRRLSLTFAVCSPFLGSVLQPLAATPVFAQEAGHPAHRTSRSLIFTVIGAVVGGAVGLAVSKGSGSSGRHGCLGVPCVFAGSVVIGAGVGFALGHGMDRTYYSRYRGVAPIRLASVDAALEGVPTSLTAGDSAVAVGGSNGVEVFGADAMQTGVLRARGLNGVSAVALAPPSGWLAVGSPAGLYMFPPHEGPGALVRVGDVAAIAGGAKHVYVAVNDRIEIAPLANDSTATWPGTTVQSPVHALAVDSARSLLWATTDRGLIAFRPDGDSLVRVGSTPLDAVGLRMAFAHDTIAVALGERGVRLFDVSDPAAPRAVASWTIAHFVYDVAIDEERLFVAAGPEGVYVIDLSTSPMRTIGLARSMGFATALASRRGYTYILDRRGVVLRRVLSDF